ncbi:hypothetical protein DPMN_030002 [Dreissena polymorpha]|uniref:Ig-like domain-containing protein n=1 Tax=Dreissena polymorpha TaxID=45954 RepID=A0A9D4RFP3_DREPO|nr:hypothetical protein DPMN_029860 [Dreissena polymorpha]KAH3866879.1 hypothetical protein DPMN_030002 [Dreissena polymorpha]
MLPPQGGKFIRASTVELLCGVSHDPGIAVTWQWVFKDKVNSNSVVIGSGGHMTIGQDGKLTINGIRLDNVGNYTCNVVSAGGNDSKTVVLEVIGKMQSSVYHRLQFIMRCSLPQISNLNSWCE